MTKKRIPNIFDRIPETALASAQLSSESSLINEIVGTCPKCGTVMTTASIATGDSVFFCEKDRVALPKPDTITLG